MTSMLAEIKEILIEQERLQQRVQELGAEISRDYRGKELHLICVLKGAVLFLADLSRNMTIPVSFDFMAVSSYGASTETSGVVRILKDLEQSIEGKDVLIVEDIIDSGLTLHYLYKNLYSRKPVSLEICTLLDKPERRAVDVPVKYCGFSIPDRFVVGYGLDYAEKFRNLPYIGVLKDEVFR
ncbi:MAG TPA: hypoxanthine phosphoribosyltransferase [Firmicutes bacterium]|nr:hypoxanthine phosphoribosyltransferase [Bacillota bacterium]